MLANGKREKPVKRDYNKPIPRRQLPEFNTKEDSGKLNRGEGEKEVRQMENGDLGEKVVSAGKEGAPHQTQLDVMVVSDVEVDGGGYQKVGNGRGRQSRGRGRGLGRTFDRGRGRGRT